MKSVSGASATESKSNTSRWACIAAIGIGFLFIVSLSNNGSAGGDDNLRSGQAKRPTTGYGGVPADSTIGSPVVDNTKNTDYQDSGVVASSSSNDVADIADEEDIEQEVEKAESHFERVVKDQLDLNQNMIVTSIAKVMEGIRESLTSLLGDSDDFDEAEIDNLGNSIEEELQAQVQKALSDRAAALVEQDDQDMEMAADLDTEGMDAGETAQVVDLKEEESKLVVQLRDGVDEIATDERGQIRHRAAMIAKRQLEALLKEKMGSSYTVTVDDNDTLVSFKKKSTKKTSSSSSSSSSSGGHSSSSTRSSSSSSGHKSSSSSSSGHHSSSSSSGHHSSSSSSSGHHSSSSGHSSTSTSGTKKTTKKKTSSSHHSG